MSNYLPHLYLMVALSLVALKRMVFKQNFLLASSPSLATPICESLPRLIFHHKKLVVRKFLPTLFDLPSCFLWSQSPDTVNCRHSRLCGALWNKCKLAFQYQHLCTHSQQKGWTSLPSDASQFVEQMERVGHCVHSHVAYLGWIINVLVPFSGNISQSYTLLSEMLYCIFLTWA